MRGKDGELDQAAVTATAAAALPPLTLAPAAALMEPVGTIAASRTRCSSRQPAAAAIAPAAAARAALVEQAAAVQRSAGAGRKGAAVDGLLCSLLSLEVTAESALAALQNSCGRLDSHSRGSVRAAFFKEETGVALKRNTTPPPESLWPGTRAKPSCENRPRPAQLSQHQTTGNCALQPLSLSLALALALSLYGAAAAAARG